MGKINVDRGYGVVILSCSLLFNKVCDYGGTNIIKNNYK